MCIRDSCEAMCIPQCNISEGHRSSNSTKFTEGCGPMSCQLRVGVPPSFFNIMTHLLVHLVDEIAILGPVFLHNMFPFERFMGVLKKYVHNRVRPEGSISKGYGTEEIIEFCVDSIPDLKPIGVSQSRHEGRLRPVERAVRAVRLHRASR